MKNSLRIRFTALMLIIGLVCFLSGCTQDSAQGVDVEPVEDPITEEESKVTLVPQEQLYALDEELLYFMGGDLDFLIMKDMARPSQDSAYYENIWYPGVEVRFYLADDQYTINHISLVERIAEEQESDYLETVSFMGLYLGMPLEAAEEYVLAADDVVVKYSDIDGDGIVHQIDVFSTLELEKRVNSEDFYFKFFNLNIHSEADYLGNNTGAQESLDIDPNEQTYTYNIVFGPDEYQKVYYYQEDGTIESMEIHSTQDEFKAVVPSLLGIQLGSKQADIEQLIADANKQLIDRSDMLSALESGKMMEKLTIMDKAAKIAYQAEVTYSKATQRVQKVKGYFTPKELLPQDDLIALIGTELTTEPQEVKGRGAEAWQVAYEAYADKAIQSISITTLEDSVYVNTVPTLCKLQLRMFTMGVYNTLINNGYEILNEESYQPFADKSLETIKYTVIEPETNAEYTIYITSKYIGDLSAAIVWGIAVGK